MKYSSRETWRQWKCLFLRSSIFCLFVKFQCFYPAEFPMQQNVILNWLFLSNWLDVKEAFFHAVFKDFALIQQSYFAEHCQSVHISLWYKHNVVVITGNHNTRDRCNSLLAHLPYWFPLLKKPPNIQLIFTTEVTRSPYNIHSVFQKSEKPTPEIESNHFCQAIGPNLPLTISNM